MDNYWLNRKVNRDEYNRSVKRLMSGDSQQDRNDEFPDFIDLSAVVNYNFRYKAYSDLKRKAVWEGIPAYLPDHL